MNQVVTKPLSFFEPYLSQAMLLIAKKTRFRSRPGLAEILAENPRLIVVFNHATPLSWLPAIALLTAHTCARGGGTRRPMGVMDRFFFSVPGLRAIAHQLTQSDRPLGFEELIAKFRDSQGTDIVIFPEGSNCFFGDPSEVQPFRSPRFVELAVRSGTPILLCAHRGSEKWAHAVHVDASLTSFIDVLPDVVSKFLGRRLRETGLLTIPRIPTQLDRFEMLCELYTPSLKESDLDTDSTKAREQIANEADLVHAKLEAMLAEIDKGIDAESGAATPVVD
jgi:1-acyl-sn-glycerol-3-phosphate acyltransferase